MKLDIKTISLLEPWKNMQAKQFIKGQFAKIDNISDKKKHKYSS